MRFAPVLPSLALCAAIAIAPFTQAAPKADAPGKGGGKKSEPPPPSLNEPAPADPAPSTGTVAYTDPMGGMVVNCPNNSDTILTIPFHRTAVYTGSIASVSSTSILLEGVPGFTANEFASGTGFFALIGSGTLSGLVLPILANTSDSLTVDPGAEDLSLLAGSDTLSVVPFWTLETLVGTSSPNGLKVLTYDLDSAGINLSASKVYTHYNTYGWYLGGTFSGNVLVYPGEGFILRNQSGADFSLIFSGSVPVTDHRSYMRTLSAGVPQDNHIGITIPVDVPLNEANLGFDADKLLIFDNATVGLNKSASKVITYYEGYGWYYGGTRVDNPADSANLLMLKAGQGYVYRKASSASPSYFDWSFTPSYLPLP